MSFAWGSKYPQELLCKLSDVVSVSQENLQHSLENMDDTYIGWLSLLSTVSFIIQRSPQNCLSRKWNKTKSLTHIKKHSVSFWPCVSAWFTAVCKLNDSSLGIVLSFGSRKFRDIFIFQHILMYFYSYYILFLLFLPHSADKQNPFRKMLLLLNKPHNR